MTSPAWRVVPAEATEEMRVAWLEDSRVGDGETLADADWRVMLAAAPRPDYGVMAVEVVRGFYGFGQGGHVSFADRSAMAAALRGYFEGE